MGQNATFSIVFSAEATVQHIDSSAEQLLGWDLEVAASAGLGLLHPSDRLAFGAMLKLLRSKPDEDVSLEVRLLAGESLAGELSHDHPESWVPVVVSSAKGPAAAEVSGLLILVSLDAVSGSSVSGNPVSDESSLLNTAEVVDDGDLTLSSELPAIAVASANSPADSIGLFDQDALEGREAVTEPAEGSSTTDLAASEPTDIGILLRPGSSVIDVVTGPVQGKLGCHPDSLAGLHLWELLHGDDEAEFTAALDAMEAKDDGEHFAFGPLRFLRPDGDERCFDTTIISRPNGLIVRARGGEDSRGLAVGSSPDDTAESAVVFLDEQFNVTYASASFSGLIGREATSAVGMELLAAVHPTDRSYVEQRLRHPAIEGEIHGFLRVPAESGWRWIEVIGRNYLDDPTVAQIALQLTAVDGDPETLSEPSTPQPERVGTFTRDRDGNVSFINDFLLEMLGSVDALDFATERSSLVNVGDDGMSETIEVDTGDGRMRFLRSRMSPIIGADGERTGDVAVVEDITQLVESGDLPDRIADGTEGSVLVVEQGVGIKYISADLAALTGAEVGTELHEFFTPKSAVLIRTEVWPQFPDNGVWSGQLWIRTIEGPAAPFHAQFYNEADLEDGRPLASVIVTPLESVPDWEHEDQLAVDPLTLLSSGAGLKRRAVRAIAKTIGNRSKVAVALVEIDRVADLIEKAGEEFSLTAAEQDALALAIADRLALACRHDESAARIDQRTFGVLSQRLGDNIDLEHLTARIADELSPTFVIETDRGQRYLTVQFSMGLAHTGDRSMSGDELFDNAGLALQRARSRGRVRSATVGENGQVELSERRSLEEEFRAALSADQLGNQLDNAYQAVFPQSIARSVVSGEDPNNPNPRFEALVRWHSPSRGLVGASEVVELAENLGMASAVGHRVLDRALEFLASVERKYGVAPRVDVNVSASQATERGFISRLDALLRLYEIDPEQLGIEVAEPVFLSADKALGEAIENLNTLGVRLVVDDATGRLFRSSLAHMNEGISELKINRRLVEGVGRHAADTAQVAGILARAQERNLTVTAVGVATGRQLDLLSELGCTWFQGFLLGRPAVGGDHQFVANANAAITAGHNEQAAG